uniref:Uncharacterized protein n=1 Tax=Avena sativa TaxID=4498 RepID=A0ACD5W206_AVESA
MSTSGRAPVSRGPVITKTPSGNPLPRRGQVKESIAKHIVAATASVLVCDAGAVGGGGKKSAGGKILPAPPGSAKKQK